MTSKWQYPTQLVHFSEGKKQIAVDRYKRRVPKTIISKETEREKREKKKKRYWATPFTEFYKVLEYQQNRKPRAS